MTEVEGKLICQRSGHNEPITVIIMEDSIQISERLLCVKCLEGNREAVKTLRIEEVQEMIKERQTQMEKSNTQQQLKDLGIITEFQQRMKTISDQLHKGFEDIISLTQQWINEYEKKGEDTQLNNLIRGLELLSQDIDQQGSMNQSYFLKLSQRVKQMISILDLKSPCVQLRQLNFKKKIKNQDKKQNVSSVSETKIFPQNDHCLAIAFNDNLMVAGCDNDIKVWKFQQGEMTELKKLKGHAQCVYCLVFSQKFNWFASGSMDKSIRGWKEQANGEWISTKPGEKHSKYVCCLILNTSEDELISSSDDCKIIVWSVDCQSNQLKYSYTLDKKHSECVYGISMNFDEKYLVTCSYDKKIILWIKDKLWKFKNEIVNDGYGYRLSFINDYQIFWQENSTGICCICEIKNEMLIKRPELNQYLGILGDDSFLFPTIFNKRRQLIVQRHSFCVALIQKQENDILKLVSKPITCDSQFSYGSLTNDGEYLVVWEHYTQQFKVYKIEYK